MHIVLIGAIIVVTVVLLFVLAISANSRRAQDGIYSNRTYRSAHSRSNSATERTTQAHERDARSVRHTNAGAKEAALRDIAAVVNGRNAWVSTSDQVRNILRSVDY